LFLRHADAYYRRPDGTPTSEPNEYRQTARVDRTLYGLAPAAAFGPLALMAMREHMIRNGLSRKVINSRIGRVKRIYKWATAHELVPSAVFHGLVAVAGLQRDRTAARERAPIESVDDRVVGATLPYLTRHVAGLVRFQRLTGCRPGEACALRRADLDTAGLVWLFTPPHHKLSHRGQVRVIAVGPRAQALLCEFPTDDAAEYVFSPRPCDEEKRADRLRRGLSPQWPSYRLKLALKRKPNPIRTPGDRYTTVSYDRAVATAVKRLNRIRGNADLGPPAPPIPCWHPNQLRHAHATAVRLAFGLEAAEVNSSATR
jgi:integrase